MISVFCILLYIVAFCCILLYFYTQSESADAIASAVPSQAQMLSQAVAALAMACRAVAPYSKRRRPVMGTLRLVNPWLSFLRHEERQRRRPVSGEPQY